MYEKYTIHELREKILNKEVSISEVLDDVYKSIEMQDENLKAYLCLTKDKAYATADILQKRLEAGEDIGQLGGIPIAIKDNMCLRDTKTTCASKILENFVSPYDATVVEQLEKAGAIIIGKTNMDEFAMGSSTATSAFQKTKNPIDNTRVPGGSSGGSAVAVAADMAIATLGSDTGGSIRQPASHCGIVGLKPTYGLISRYGLVAFASSLDQIGPFTKDVLDSAIMLNVLAKKDEKDTTSVEANGADYTTNIAKSIDGLTLGVPFSFISNGLNDEVKMAFEKVLEAYKNMGAKIQEISLDYAKYALPAYYIISMAEASSNLARYDGIKYGYRAKEFDDLKDLYKRSRTEGFGDEVKRRIMLGTYVLSSGYYDAYYKRAGKVRNLIINDFKKAFEKVDAILLPTVPSVAFKFGEKLSNPVEMYLEDILTVPVNIAGLPGISIPCGTDVKGMPIGLQIISKAFDEEKLLNIAYKYEQQHKKEANNE